MIACRLQLNCMEMMKSGLVPHLSIEYYPKYMGAIAQLGEQNMFYILTYVKQKNVLLQKSVLVRIQFAPFNSMI